MTYREAGVDLDAADRHVESISESVRATWTSDVIGGFGGFAAGVSIPKGIDDPVLMMTTDGVGTKLEVARRSGMWEGVGFDLVAMCVDDLAAVGAAPLGFVDYLAVGALDGDRDRTIVESIARACSEAGCALLGGETAEHPGVMTEDAVDLAGAAMGVMERGAELGKHKVGPGDVVIGLASPNLRSNGFSLVRHVVTDEIPDATLLAPSIIYSPHVIPYVGLLNAAAHITGGGLPGNLARAVPDGCGVTIDTATWEPPEVFSMIASTGVGSSEMFNTFNMGIGFCLVASEENSDVLVDGLSNLDAAVIGKVREGSGVVFE